MHSPLTKLRHALVVGTLITGPAIAQDVAPAHTETVKRIVDSQSFKAAVDALQKDHDRWISEVIKLTEIPAPPFKEQERAKAYMEMLKAHGLTDVEIDQEGNAIGVRKGTGGGPLVVVSAHLDTVFPEGTDVTVKRDGSRLAAPGISDDSAGLATLLSIVRAMNAAGIKTKSDIVFMGTVGEEGPGDLRGVRYSFTEGKYKDQVKYFFSLDGGGTPAMTNCGVGSKRYRVTYKGPGGHSYQAFGLVNPAFAMGNAIQKFSEIKVPTDPKTTFNVGVVGGGTSVNSIPYEMWMDVDMRSVSPDKLNALTEEFKAAMHRAAEDENTRRSTKEGPISVDLKLIGDRPSGITPVDHPLVQIASAVMKKNGLTPIYVTTSTDANIPISLGIPAITIAAGGNGSAYHSLKEWTDVDKSPSVKGIETALVVLLAAAGIQ